jgi:hypothetical protein
MVLTARRAALEVCAHAGNFRVGIGSAQLELDVAIQLLKALLAADLRPGWPQEAL